ncbi:MAG: hypothetical protein HYY81_05610 [Deltaproteobacteria bacterium]|nr:hypothetical protein [Deltaproteobacteria bacterium]
MGNETFKKRQKEVARQEKRKKKAAQRMERRSERTDVGKPLPGEDPQKTHRNW